MNGSMNAMVKVLEPACDVLVPGGKSADGFRLPPDHDGRCDSRAPRTPAVAMETILIATDFSQNAVHGMERAAALADEVAMSKAVLLHVLPESPVESVRRLFRGPEGFAEYGSERSLRQLGEIGDRLQKRAGLVVDVRVPTGNVVKTIGQFGSGVDLLILGAQGNHPIRDFALGSTAQRVLRKTRQPVLVVKQKPRAAYRRVLVAVDPALEPGNALALAQTLAPGAKLNLMHVYRVPQEGRMRQAGVANASILRYRGEAKASAASGMTELVLSRLPGADVRLLLAHGYAVPRLLEMERELQADLLVVTKGASSFSKDLLVESVTLQLLARSQCDVLVVHEPPAGF